MLYVILRVARLLWILLFFIAVYRQLKSQFCRGWTFFFNVGNEHDNVLVTYIQKLPNHP